MTRSSRLVRAAVNTVRLWTRAYTLGMPPDIRDRRLAEIESDLWESCHEATDSRLLALTIAGRWLRGSLDDVRWRLSFLGDDQRAVRLALATGVGVSIVVASLWLLVATRAGALPHPPAAPDLITKRGKYPPPPPPPPPPCNPPGIGRPPVTPCTPL